MHSEVTRSITVVACLMTAMAVAACGDYRSDPGSGPDQAARSARRADPSGDGQTGSAGQDLEAPLRIVVLQGGAPEAGAVVTWSSAANGAFLTPAVDTTGPDGISASTWHLGDQPGPQMSQATVAGGADGAPVSFSATANGPDGGPAGAVEIQLLTSGGNRFEPSNVTVAVGTTVTWTWVGGFHDVTSSGNPGFTSSGAPVAAPKSFSHTFTTPGTYLYFCSVHGSPTAGMRGTVVVQ